MKKKLDDPRSDRPTEERCFLNFFHRTKRRRPILSRLRPLFASRGKLDGREGVTRGWRGDVESVPAEPDAGSTSSRYTLLLVGLAHVALQTAAVCFAVASEMLLQTQAACGAGGAGGEGGSFEVTTALTVVALVAHLATVVVGHGYAFDTK